MEPPATGPRTIEIEDGQMSVVPRGDSRSVFYVTGASGSGKSVFVSNLLAEWCHKHPDGQVYFISRLDSDTAFEDLPIQRVKVDESLVTEPLTVDEFPENCFVVYDDIDTIPNKAVSEAVQALLRDMLEVGRHKNISVAVTSHLATNYSKTRTILNEAHFVVCFAHGSSAQAIKYIMKTYCGLDNDDVKKLLKLPSRWVCVRRHYPPAVVYGGGAYLIGGGE